MPGNDRKLIISVAPFSAGTIGSPADSRISHTIERPDDGKQSDSFVPGIEMEILLDAPETEDRNIHPGNSSAELAGITEDVAADPPEDVTAAVTSPIVLWRSARVDIGEVLLKKLRTAAPKSLQLPVFAGETVGGKGPVEVRIHVLEHSTDVPNLRPTPQIAGHKPKGPDDIFRLFVGADVEVLYHPKDEPGPTPKSIFTGTTEIGLEIDFDESDWNGFVNLKPTAFRLDPLRVTAYTKQAYHTNIGAVASIYVPKGAGFIFDLDPRNPSLSFSKERTRLSQPVKPPYLDEGDDLQMIVFSVPGRAEDQNTPDTIRKPGDKSYTFELDAFSVGPAGLDLKGGVRAENVSLWTTKRLRDTNAAGSSEEPAADSTGVPENPKNQTDTGLDRPVAVEAPKKQQENQRRVGEIEIKSGRLAYLALRASAKLHYFDDAVGTLTVLGSQDENSGDITVVGTFEISGRQTFHIDPIFAQVEVTHVVLSTTWSEYKNKLWVSEGRMTGSMKFSPAKGKSSSDLGVFARMFEGVTVSFEDLDIVRLGVSRLKIEVTPAIFTIADILQIEIKGIEFFPASEPGGLVIGNKNVRVLGGIEILKLPAVDAKLKFGGINIRQKSDRILPIIDLERISLSLALPGGFKIGGTAVEIKNEAEYGFGGEVFIETEGLPRMDGLIKLTRVRVTWKDGDQEYADFIPSIAVCLEREWTILIYGGFFLRRIGMGVGMYQGLRGLVEDKPIAEKIEEFVNDPCGLPNPGRLDSWLPDPPPEPGASLKWTMVGQAYLTYGNAPPNVEHVMRDRSLLPSTKGSRLLPESICGCLPRPIRPVPTISTKNPLPEAPSAFLRRNPESTAHLSTSRTREWENRRPMYCARCLMRSKPVFPLSLTASAPCTRSAGPGIPASIILSVRYRANCVPVTVSVSIAELPASALTTP